MSTIGTIVRRLLGARKHSEPQDNKEMSFLEHLEELRIQIIKALIGICISTIFCAIYSNFIVEKLLLYPLRSAGLKSQVLSPYGIVLLYMQAVLICGLILSMPYTIYCFWKFVAPGLLPSERKYISRITFFTTICFICGVVFSYLVIIPVSLKFFSTFGTETIELNIALDQYVSFILVLLIGGGLIFEFPMISYFLTKMGLLTPSIMRKYRRHAILAIFIISAIVTPSVDAVTQLLLAIPMVLLYEISIIVSALTKKENLKNRTSNNDK